MGNISLATALVAGKKRVPKPAAGITAFLTFIFHAHPFLLNCIYYNITLVKNTERKSTKKDPPAGN
ncbi:hypothetical protein TH6N_16990 [Tetragenococcus halophilus]|nr:hypothetical protein TH6N_16990 [Tetragenococcus halophilus]GEQ47619.1 hypothetical protein TH9N_17320 [Tetragenococcus halophilus]